MKRQIRRCAFETNSSSTHAICITKEDVNKNNIKGVVSFTHGEFGWENTEYHDIWSKASYLYQAICDCNSIEEREEKLEKIKNVLSTYGIECNFGPDKDKEWGDGYIDHCGGTYDFVSSVLNDEDKLIKYLFGNSFIITGNDNEDIFKDRMYVNNGDEVIGDYHYTNYGELKPEFDNYDVFKKGN